MSLESALEEERLEILKLLERPNTKSPPPSSRSNYGPSSPLGSRTASPNRGKITSLIDIASPPSSLSSKKSPTASPTLKFSTPAGNGLYRPRHDSAGSSSAPRLLRDLDKPESIGFTPHEGYHFAMGPSLPPQVPKRVSQGGKKVSGVKPPIRSMLGDLDEDFAGFKGKLGGRSASPATNAALRAHARSASPRPGWETNSARSSSGRLSSPPPENRFVLPSDEIDLSLAYQKLNDEALSRSGGILGTLPEKKPVINELGEPVKPGSGESVTKEGGVRLQKDYDEKSLVDSSDENSTDDGESSDGEGKSDDEDSSNRGRRQSRDENGVDGGEGSQPAKKSLPIAGRRVSSLLSIGTGSSKKKASEKKKAMSLLAAAEEERAAVSSKYKVRSLLPSISITQPGSAVSSGPSSPISQKRSGVHPATNFDIGSTNSTPMSSETEAEMQEYRRAQKMEMVISPITSTPETHRVVRTIIRGDFDKLQEEAEQGKRRQRTYLVATDMSAEAAHALEWTIGTVLRDGDTMQAIYAADEDSVDTSAITPTSATSVTLNINGEGGIPEGLVIPAPVSPRILMTSPILGSAAPSAPSSPMVSFSTPASRASTPPPGGGGMSSRRGSGEKKRGISRDRGNSGADKGKAELERIVAAENITQLITKLLKKTRLQVRCVVEVIHCKSPKHLLTEMIDYIEPTLVILGSRGRSALKGVLLGSFSNYLVTKSSVPVMVARKKLKQHTKQKKKGISVGGAGGVNPRLTNNLVSGLTGSRVGGNLAMAKVD